MVRLDPTGLINIDRGTNSAASAFNSAPLEGVDLSPARTERSPAVKGEVELGPAVSVASWLLGPEILLPREAGVLRPAVLGPAASRELGKLVLAAANHWVTLLLPPGRWEGPEILAAMEGGVLRPGELGPAVSWLLVPGEARLASPGGLGRGGRGGPGHWPGLCRGAPAPSSPTSSCSCTCSPMSSTSSMRSSTSSSSSNMSIGWWWRADSSGTSTSSSSTSSCGWWGRPRPALPARSASGEERPASRARRDATPGRGEARAGRGEGAGEARGEGGPPPALRPAITNQ